MLTVAVYGLYLPLAARKLMIHDRLPQGSQSEPSFIAYRPILFREHYSS